MGRDFHKLKYSEKCKNSKSSANYWKYVFSPAPVNNVLITRTFPPEVRLAFVQVLMHRTAVHPSLSPGTKRSKADGTERTIGPKRSLHFTAAENLCLLEEDHAEKSSYWVVLINLMYMWRCRMSPRVLDGSLSPLRALSNPNICHGAKHRLKFPISNFLFMFSLLE